LCNTCHDNQASCSQDNINFWFWIAAFCGSAALFAIFLQR
jgi:hypothetical protein